MIVILFLSYFSNHILQIIFSKKHRANVKTSNIKIDELRKKSMKTLEEQKEFINAKFPKRKKFKWSWRIIPKILFRIILFMILIRFYYFIFAIFNIQLQLWQAILFVMIFPIIANLILERFKMQKSDFSVFFKGWFK